MSTKFFNATPHAINIMADTEFVPSIRKYMGGAVVTTIPASGIMLNAVLRNVPVTTLDGGIPLVKNEVIDCDPIPAEALQADYIIVSALYAGAYRQLHGDDGVRLLTIHQLVVKSADDPRPVGCVGFSLA